MEHRTELTEIQEEIRSIKIREIEDGMVVVQFKIETAKINYILSFVVLFIEFTKTYFFPEGVFRSPKLREVWRNFKIVLGVVRLKNLLQKIFKGKPTDEDFDKEMERLQKMQK